jgi:hypothetical protein
MALNGYENPAILENLSSMKAENLIPYLQQAEACFRSGDYEGAKGALPQIGRACEVCGG